MVFLAISIQTAKSQDLVFIHTDRDIYQSGDPIYFKAYTNFSTLGSAGRDLEIRIVNSEGAVVQHIHFDISGRTMKNVFELPNALAEGAYQLLASIKGAPIEQAFSKEFLIRELELPAILIKIPETLQAYHSGDEVVIPLALVGAEGNTLGRKVFAFTVFTDGAESMTGKGKTDKEGLAEISFTYPIVSENQLVSLEILVDFLGYTYSNALLLPNKDQALLVDFHPEGGLIIDGFSTLISFRSFNLYGEPLAIKADLVGPDNQLIQQIESSQPGLGMMTIKADARVPLKIRIVEPEVYAGALFDLPKIESNGVVLRFKEQQERSLLFELTNPVADTYMTLTVQADQYNQAFYSKRILVQSAKTFEVPTELFKRGIVELSVLNDRNEIIARRSVAYEPFETQSPVFESMSASAVDEVFAPEWKSAPGLSTWFQSIPELAQSQIDRENQEAFMLGYLSGSSLNEKDLTEEDLINRKINARYRLTSLEQYISEVKIKQFFNQHFLSPELEFGKYYTDNRMLLDEFGLIPQKLSLDERVQRQLESGKPVLSVIRSIRAYRLVSNQMIFRGGSDSFTNPAGSIIVIDGVAKGSNISVIENLSPYDVSSIKVSTSVSDIMKYAGMEDTAGVVIITTKKTDGKKVEKSTNPIGKYQALIKWDPDFLPGSQLLIPERKINGPVRYNELIR